VVAPTRLAGRYAIDEQVGIGGMGTVFSATDERLGRRVAVKLLKEELASDPKFIERFRREARAAAALSHPNVASVFDYGESDGRPFIVMELIDGRDLSRVMRDDGPLDEPRTRAIAAQIAVALGHAHSAGLVHRDVKPHNVIVTGDDRVKVTDFGIARATGESTLTATGTILGTAQYISPEQASGESLGPPSDVYSLGIVLYEMLTGAVPFTGDSPVSVALRHVRDQVPAPSSIDPTIPAEYDDLVAKATAKQPEDRFVDGADFAAALSGAAAVAPTTVVMTDPSAEGAPWPFATPPRWDPARIGKTVIAVFAVLFLIALGALAFRLADTTEKIRDRNRDRAAAAGPSESPSEPSTQPSFTVGDYRGAPASEAVAELEANDVETIQEPTECGQPEGYVCEQSPDPGSTIAAGEAVTLVVSTSEGDDEEHGKSDEGKEDEGPPDEPPGQTKKDKDDD
jgi:predicted Ser/Thr protein kinase